MLEPWTDQIEHWLKQDKLKLTRIQDLLAQRHCLLAYTCLRRYVTRKGWFGKGSHTTVRMADTEPGQMAEVDFGRLGLTDDTESDRRRLASGMLTVMGYSRHQFLWPLFGQQLWSNQDSFDQNLMQPAIAKVILVNKLHLLMGRVRT